ncbi:YWFCY domain-containing protein [Dyadobacter sp. CY327]|uniref:YWFCY domain-containing protein n=1 Tax=Dyadobacter sp. CY327 TaxID=2907301 RepID=UPI002103DF66|nr:YWFCY domain-containing protein [Dyadobacter sp. CY327]
MAAHGQSATSKNYLLATHEQSNDARLFNGEDSLFDPAKQDDFTPAHLRGRKRRKKKGFSQSLQTCFIMASNTGKNEISLRKITDRTRLISILVLALHFYYFGYQAFQNWHLTSLISDRILDKILPQGCSLCSVKRRFWHSFS